MSSMPIPEGHVELLRALQSHLQSRRARGWLVGGYVRDLFLGRVSGDIDIAVDGDALALSRSFADTTGGSWVLLDEKRNAARIVWPTAATSAGWPRIVDLARLRAPALAGDLREREFTIKALAVPLDQAGNFDGAHLIDPLGGLHDLRQGILRLCSPRAILDDWLRMLRAVRIGALLDFRLADDLDAELRARHALLKALAAERVRDLVLQLVGLPPAGEWLRYLRPGGPRT